MKPPVVSVVIPLYNCAPFLREAMDSLLAQTFTDFELICINDGSTDDTEKIVLSYTDPRIIYIKNEKNHGIVYGLNKGIEIAKGKYIARMDGDDICLHNRFSRQVEFLEANKHVAVLSSNVELIDENSKVIGFWSDEKNTITAKEIRKKLKKTNCIAHPTIIARSEILKSHLYASNQKDIEDYDLWIRLESENILIHKLPLVLVRHRINSASVTRKRQGQNLFFKRSLAKRTAVWSQVKSGRLNFYLISIFLHSMIDFIQGIGKQVKRTLVYNK